MLNFAVCQRPYCPLLFLFWQNFNIHHMGKYLEMFKIFAQTAVRYLMIKLIEENIFFVLFYFSFLQSMLNKKPK